MPLLIVTLTSLLATVSTASIAAPTNAPAQSANAASVEPAHPQNATDESDPPLMPAQKAAGAAYRNYMGSLMHSLRTSADARDRALATTMSFTVDFFDTHEPTPADRVMRGAMLRGAAEAAPDDALVQWFWASASLEDSGCNASSPCPHRVEAAARLQPDNGSAWLPVFNAAWRVNDIPAAESALAQMAHATRFDEQMGTALKAWMDVYRRYPMPKSVIVKDSSDAMADDQSRNFTSSMAWAAATAIPAYDPLVKACSREKHPEASALRFHDCAQVGRLMLMQSTTLIGRQIGRALLRVSGQATAADIANARVVDWQYEQLKMLAAAQAGHESADLKTAAADWLNTGDEIKTLQRRMQRAGIPLTPPADWQPTRNGKPISPLGESTAPAKQP